MFYYSKLVSLKLYKKIYLILFLNKQFKSNMFSFLSNQYQKVLNIQFGYLKISYWLINWNIDLYI